MACLGCVAVGCGLWGLILFGPAQSIIHQGSLLLPVLAVAGAVAGLRAVFPRIALAVVLRNIVIVLLLYVPVLDPTPGPRYSAAAAAAVAACLLAFVAVALHAREPAFVDTSITSPQEPRQSPRNRRSPQRRRRHEMTAAAALLVSPRDPSYPVKRRWG
jgi:hypothetical protein